MADRLVLLPLMLVVATVAGCAGGRNAGREDTAQAIRQDAARFLQQSSDTPRRCLFGFAASPSMYVYALTPRASDSGLRKGDRVVSVGGVRIFSGSDFRGALSKASVGDLIPFEVARGAEKATVRLTCNDPGPVVNSERTLFKAAERGDWDGCIAASGEMGRTLGVVTPQILGWRLRCVDAKRLARRQPMDVWGAQLAHEFWRLRLQEAAYEPDGVPALRGQILSVTTLMRQHGFNSLAEDLERQLVSARDVATSAPPQAESPAASQGTAFAITADGLFLTAAHVIDGGKAITLRCPGRKPVYASAVQIARNVDLATLRAPLSEMTYMPFADARSVRSGEAVFTVGFPTPDILGYEPKFSDGSVSALSGLGGEASFLQITVPIQPGNSGGPLLNNAGSVVGVVTSSAAIVPFLKATGTLPQNVSWAVKAEYALPLLDRPAARLNPTADRGAAVERAKRATCLVETTR